MTSTKNPDEIELDRLTTSGTRTGPPRSPPKITLWTLLRSPFITLHRIFTFITTLLPYLSRLTFKPTTTPARRQLSPADTASRFIREFEELYGPRHIAFENRGYAEVTSAVKELEKYLLVVLISEEHDDTAGFCKEVCCDEGFQEWIQTNDCLVWGGNIADSEAHTVSNSLTCTRFPFVALIANIPSPTPTSPAQMTLLTRIEGPISATRLIATLATSVSRTKSILIQRRAIKADQDFTRQLRRQQEEAYTNSLAQDRLREETERRRIAEVQRLERERLEKEKEKERRKRNREQWRLWKAGELRKCGIVGIKNEIGKTARVGLRLINGERIVQPIPGDFTLAEVYSFVECYDLLFPAQQREEGKSGVTLRSSREEGEIEEDVSVEKPGDYEHEFMFRLVVPYPRKVIDSGFTLVKNEGGLWPSGSIVVEEIEEEEEDEEDEDEDEEEDSEED